MDSQHLYRSVICSHCGNVITFPVSCGNRFCSICQGPRNRKIRTKLEQFVKTRHPRGADTFKLLTLSIASSDDLRAQVIKLRSSFRRLRQRSFWKKSVRGGAFVIELARSDAGWHAHLHILLESAYIPWNRLKLHWEAVSGGSGCHITRIPASAIVKYVTKYVTKSGLEPSLQQQASFALAGFRMFQPFGQWHNPINRIKVPHAVCSVCEHSAWIYLGAADICSGMDKSTKPAPGQASERHAKGPPRRTNQLVLDPDSLGCRLPIGGV